MFELSYPWFLALLPLPLLIRWLLPVYKESKQSVRVSKFDAMVMASGQTPSRGAVILQRMPVQKILVSLTWLLIVLAMAKPQMIGDPVEQTKSARDLMVAVDLSGSMEAADFTTAEGEQINRLQAVKLVLAEFVAQREHDRLGLIVFGSAPYLQTPFTEDLATFTTLLNETEIAMAGQSTVFGDAIGLAIKVFEGSDTDNRVLIVLTDGNDTGSKVPPVEAAKVAKSRDVTIYTIAIGDPSTTGEEALDLEVMQDIADITGGQFYQALDREQLQDVYRQINALEPQAFESLSFRPTFTLHHYCLAAVLVGYIAFLVVMTIRSRRQAMEAVND